MILLMLGLVMLSIGGMLFVFGKTERYWETHSNSHIKSLLKTTGVGLVQLFLISLAIIAAATLFLFITSIY